MQAGNMEEVRTLVVHVTILATQEAEIRRITV
jgi:hypothetical protein